MKKILFVLYFCWIPVVFAQQRVSEDSRFDLLHTELHIKPIWHSKTLEGEAKLLLKPYFYPQNKLVLNAKDFIINSITSSGNTLPYRYDNRLVEIELDKTYTRNDTVQIVIKYLAQPEKIKEIAGEENKSEKGLYFVNSENKIKGYSRQLWTQGETQSSSSWFPTLDFPNQNHTQDIYITVDENLTTLSNGILISTKRIDNKLKVDHWSQNQPHAVYLSMIAVGDFVKVVDSTFNRFEVSYYVEPKYRDYALPTFGRTPEMINYFEGLLGVPYPWTKYAQIPVRQFVTGAMENTSATTHGTSILQNANQVVAQNNDDIIAHELFHHWFGNLVTCESWGQLPMNEAFANYAEYLWTYYKYGEEEGDYNNYYNLFTYLQGEADRPLIRYNYQNSEEMFDVVSYQKGGRILHTLRKEVSDEAFFKALNVYLIENSYKTTEMDKLRLVFERVTGRELKWFFNQWFLGKGHPDVSIRHKLENQKLKLEITQQIDSLGQGVFRIPLSLKVLSQGHVKDTLLQLNQQKQQFEIPFEGDFKTFIPNEDGSFLGVVSDDRTAESYLLQYQLSSKVIARIAALGKISTDSTITHNQLDQLYLQALDDSFWRIRQLAVWALNDYDGESFFKVEKKLEALIQNDPNPNVRADALHAVKNFENPFHLSLARTALKDTAYVVQAAGLELLLNADVEDATGLVNVYQDIEDHQIFAAVASYFVENLRPDKLHWFIDRLSTMDAGDGASYMGLLGSYLVVSDEVNVEEALPYLLDNAISESLPQLRFSAVQVLFTLKDISDAAQEAFDKAVAAEKDEHLLNYYRQLDVER